MVNGKIIKKIEDEIKDTQENWADDYKNIISEQAGIGDEPMPKSKRDKVYFLEHLDIEGDDYVNLSYSQGYVLGLKVALRFLKS